VEKTLVIGVVPGGKTMPEGYTKWPVFGAVTVQSVVLGGTMTWKVTDEHGKGVVISIAVTTKDWLAGTEYGAGCPGVLAKVAGIDSPAKIGMASAFNWTNCAAWVAVLCVIAGFAAVFATCTKAAANAWAARGAVRVSAPAARANAPKETIDFGMRIIIIQVSP
jgi:hypothetical protein